MDPAQGGDGDRLSGVAERSPDGASGRVAYSLGAHASDGSSGIKAERRNDRAVIVQAAYRGPSGWRRKSRSSWSAPVRG